MTGILEQIAEKVDRLSALVEDLVAKVNEKVAPTEPTVDRRKACEILGVDYFTASRKPWLLPAPNCGRYVTEEVLDYRHLDEKARKDRYAALEPEVAE